ncbi:HTH-type transcriptional regulator GltC [Baekduia alba]|uniref:LysR family transcriptional regulator n=1 Tax=Baekduia alba TaxID=2997333 RepID=UPI0023400541|nr:LysR family transcriptional regulator [Baekduia alba]WCB93540.1 HTH-type transcriptional regulator GltC [Baekduia alba]
MLDLRRLRLLRELHARGTIVAVADALQYTPSAVSQQLAVLEREAGRPLLERAGRGVRLTDDALVLVGHAELLLRQAELAEADLAAGAGRVAGRARIASFQSMAMRVAVPTIGALAVQAPDLRCELVEAEPEQALPALALGDVDLVLADEWRHQPRARPEGVEREDIIIDAVSLVLPADHPAARARRAKVELSSLAGQPWVTGHPGTGWEEMTTRACRGMGGFDPDIRHRSNDSVIGLALVAAGQAVMLMPELVGLDDRPGIAVRAIAEGSIDRTIFMATRAADARRPSIQALRAAVRATAGSLPVPRRGRAAARA